LNIIRRVSQIYFLKQNYSQSLKYLSEGMDKISKNIELLKKVKINELVMMLADS
jgi:hypothetical protein